MLDIGKLRLTSDEVEAWLEKRFGPDNLANREAWHDIADAQLAKGLWGVRNWMLQRDPSSYEAMLLAAALVNKGMLEPTVKLSTAESQAQS